MNKKIWYKFMNGEVAINFETEEEVNSLLQIKMVRDIGYSMDFTKYDWNTFKSNTCFYMDSTFSKRELNFGHKSMFFRVYTYKELMKDDEPDYIENKFGIKKDSIYRIEYKSIDDVLYRHPLSNCKLKKLKGSITNFSTNQIAIDTDKGMQIINFGQIVEMVVID